jgi:hypothetical protein
VFASLLDSASKTGGDSITMLGQAAVDSAVGADSRKLRTDVVLARSVEIGLKRHRGISNGCVCRGCHSRRVQELSAT